MLAFGQVDPSMTTTPTTTQTPLKPSRCARFWGLDLPLANTTTHTSGKRAQPLVFEGWAFLWPAPPRKRARPLVIGRWTFLWPPPPTTPENERKHLFSVVGPSSGHHHHPHTPKMLVFGGWVFLWPPSPHTNPGNEHNCSFSGVAPSSGQYHHPHTPKTSHYARSQEVVMFLATTPPHNNPENEHDSSFSGI